MSAGSNLDQFEIKERIRQATDIVELVSAYGEMRRQGRLWVTRCPWHDDRKPSLQVNPARQSWKCWVCDLGGDVFSFLMKREGLTFPEALQSLAERAGIAYQGLGKSDASQAIAARDQRTAMYAAMRWAVIRFHEYLLSDDSEAIQAHEYLLERGLSSAAIEAFQIGYAPNQWSWLTDQAAAAGHSCETLKLIGVAQQRNSAAQKSTAHYQSTSTPEQRSSSGSGSGYGSREQAGYYDFYRGRVIFPIFDTQNRAISLGGRILPAVARQEEAAGRNAAKYINGPETKIYTKSDNLFGLNLVRAAVEKSRHLVIVEGYTDVTMAWQAGLDNVVAVQGTALNERHIRLINRFADRVTLVLDGDEAGIKRTNDILNLFVAEDMDLRIMIPPDGLDPCDFLLQRSATEFKTLLDAAEDALEYKISVETSGFDPVLDTARAGTAIQEILSTIAQTPRSLVMARTERMIREQQILARLSRRFQVEQTALADRLKELRDAKQRSRIAERRYDSPDAALDSGSRNIVPAGTHARQRNDGDRHHETTGVSPADSFQASSSEMASPKWAGPGRWDWKQQEVLELLILQPDFLELVVERIPATWFSAPPTRAIFDLFCGCYEDGIVATFEQLTLRTNDPQLQNILLSLDEAAQEKVAASSQSVEDRMSTVLDWFFVQEVKAGQRKTLADLAEKKLDPGQELAQLQALIQQERQRQGIRVPTDG